MKNLKQFNEMRKATDHFGVELGQKQINYICDGIDKEYLDKFEILVDDGIFYINLFPSNHCPSNGKYELWEFDRIQDLRDFIHLEYYMANNKEDKVLEIIKKNRNLDYRSIDNWPIRWASKNGYAEVVKLLLQDSRVDPSDNGINDPIKFASAKGHTEVVKLLLQDDRVDPSDGNNYSIRLASEWGYTEIVELLLKDDRVDPSDLDNYAIRCSSQNGHVEVVKLLLQDERVDPGAWSNHAIRWASKNGYTEIVKILLQDDRVDPSADNNYSIRWASERGHNKVIKLLIQHQNVRDTLTKKQIEKYEEMSRF